MINYESLEKVLSRNGYKKTNTFSQGDDDWMVDFSSKKTTRIYTAIGGKYGVECVMVSDADKNKKIKNTTLKGLEEVIDSLNS